MRKTMILALLLAAGCEGDPGDKGADGADGAAGADGADGAAGEDGATGEDGAAGADGEDGEDGLGWDGIFTGAVTGADGPVSGASVSMWIVDQHAQPVGRAFAASTTAEDGTFQVSLADIDDANLSMMAVAQSPGGDVFATFVYDTELSLSPGSTAVTDIISWIVHEDGERSLWDYDTTEVAGHVADAESALATAGTDLSDWDAVIDEVLASEGGDIADSSEGAWSASVGASPVTTEPTDADTGANTSSYTYLYDGAGEEWDLYYYYGYVSDGGSDAYDSWNYLYIDDSLWSAADYGSTEDTNEVVYDGSSTMSGLTVSRKVYVDPVESYCRYMEVLTNDTAADITVDARLQGNLGSDESNDDVEYSSSGDTTFDSSDIWITNHQDSSDPVIGWIVPGVTDASKSSDNLYAYWDGITVPAGETVTIIHWSLQDSSGTSADMATELGAAVSSQGPNDSYWYGGLSSTEVAQNVSVLSDLTVVGEAGSVAPYAEVTATNTTTGESVTGTARSDGSFGLFLDTSSGDTVDLSASDGSTGSVTVP